MADSLLENLTAASALGGSELFYAVQGSSDVKATATQLKTFAKNGLVSTDLSDFTEAAQDAIGAMVDSSLVYVDGTPLLTRAALTGDVSAAQGSNTLTIGALLLDDAGQVGGGSKKWKYRPFWPAPLKADPAKKRRKREEEEILILAE